ncbi:Crp/Fnr family transcriptional regulator [Aurantiacibacter spongiae]|uniref:Crp/Fnr family transcriptional regulator n=1 Tax=Aurantiacibacter spongiae TaxID=2488860 RepID=A0A3N5DHP2_9SPHN|nr:Crp/Fnr family transcriptional regulator [Aurantiacibacter spongiae]RPF71182.1 Crp/Fnr family transcriptional regulator [Aurantiacibacter spongiae]
MTDRTFASPDLAGDNRRSALERKLGHYMTLTYSERDALRWLERRERRYAAGSVVLHENEETDALHVVASGWLHGSTRLPDEARQILRFYFVGDLTTTFSIAWGVSAATLTAVSDCTLYEFPRDALWRIFSEHPRLAGLFYGVAASEQVAMADRLTSVGRTDAITRIGKLLLDIRSQLRVVDGESGSTFELPLTLQDLGDAVGLTKTHVSRTLKKLEDQRLLERDGRIIRIVDVAELASRVGFEDRYGHIATDWLPDAAPR